MFLNARNLRVLAIGAHPDDIELGCGGLIYRLVSECSASVMFLVVRPGRGILRSWVEHFRRLYEDPVLLASAEEDRLKKIFLHQTALVGAALKSATRAELLELPPEYNYPLFFKEMFGAVEEFGSLADVVTLRYDVYFRNPAPGWHERLQGPPARVAWLRDRLGRD